MARGSTPNGLTRRERLMRHIVAGPNGCWQWAAFIKPNGYGQFDKNSGRTCGEEQATRVVTTGSRGEQLDPPPG